MIATARNRTSQPLWPYFLLLFIAADLVALSFTLGQRDYLRNPVWVFLVIYALHFFLYCYASARIVPKMPAISEGRAFAVIVVTAVLMRACVLPAPPSLSTDMYRYVWDGRLTLHGINPYHWTPNAQTLRGLRDNVWDNLDYKAYQTIYMPASQVVFALGYVISGGNLIGYKILFTAFDLGAIWLLIALLREVGRPRSHVIWYAWCPLPITEVSLAGHQDIVGVFFLLAAIYLMIRRRPNYLSAIALVAAGFTKGFALLLIPLFCRRYGWRYVQVAVIALVYIGMPMWVFLPEFLHGMKQYLETVHVNSGLYYGIDHALSGITRYHFTITSYLSDAAILSTMAIAALLPARDTLSLLRRAFAVIAVTLLAVPTLFPWYLLWVLPFLPLLRERPSWSFIVLCWLVSLVYSFYISMRPYWWMSLVEYVPFYTLLLWEFFVWKRTAGGKESLGHFKMNVSRAPAQVKALWKRYIVRNQASDTVV